MNGTMVAGEYRDDGTISIRLVLQEKPCFALKIGDKYALDSLAVEECLTCAKQCPNDCPMDKPSEDALELVRAIRKEHHAIDESGNWHDVYDLYDIAATALITTRDERIRRESADKALAWLDDESGKDYPAMDDISLRNAIMGGKE